MFLEQVYTNPQGRICLARKFYEDLRLDIAEAYRRLVQDPHQVVAQECTLRFIEPIIRLFSQLPYLF